MGGDLRQHLRETQLAYQGDITGNAIEEKMLADLMYNLIGAISHMHSKGIFHRDIKLDNLFVPEAKRLPFVLLSNFCYSESFKLNKGASSPAQGYKKCGTPGYVAPEIFKTKNYDQKIDIFSLGVVFYILVYGKMPFEGKDQEEILKANERGEIDFKAE
jgi:calcium/calmodulin-dependent protein kinase I